MWTRLAGLYQCWLPSGRSGCLRQKPALCFGRFGVYRSLRWPGVCDWSACFSACDGKNVRSIPGNRGELGCQSKLPYIWRINSSAVWRCAYVTLVPQLCISYYEFLCLLIAAPCWTSFNFCQFELNFSEFYIHVKMGPPGAVGVLGRQTSAGRGATWCCVLNLQQRAGWNRLTEKRSALPTHLFWRDCMQKEIYFFLSLCWWKDRQITFN